jgi:hypothetical protein
MDCGKLYRISNIQNTNIKMDSFKSFASLQIKTVLLLLFLSLFTDNLFSQPGYREGFIVLNHGDTIHGKIGHKKISDVYRYCIFREGNKSKQYFPEEIAGYGFSDNNSFFSSQVKPGSFVEVLITGSLSLYKYKQHYYVQKEGDSLLILEHKKVKSRIDGKSYLKEDYTWRGILTSLSSDCPEIRKRLRKAWFNEKNITGIVSKYHKCTGAEFNERKANRPWKSVGVEMNAGLIHFKISNINGNFHLNELDIEFIGPTAGITLFSLYPRTIQNFSVQLEALYQKGSYTSSTSLTSDDIIKYTDVQYQLNSLTFPLSVRYTSYNPRFPFYVFVGMSYSIFMESEILIRDEIVENNIVKTYQKKDDLNDLILFGLNSGFGVPLSYKGINGSIETRMMAIAHFGSGIITSSINLKLRIL